MIVKTLAVGKTHGDNSSCPARIMQDPLGNWYCIDCGLQIMWESIEVEEKLTCTNCGTKLEKDERYVDFVCSSCGAAHSPNGKFMGHTFFVKAGETGYQPRPEDKPLTEGYQPTGGGEKIKPPSKPPKEK